jgi:hypothetical protein
MRFPKSEDEAFRLLCVSIAVIAIAVVVGALTEPLVGAVLFGGAVLGVVAWEVLSRDPERQPLRLAASEGRAHAEAGPWRVLVIANQTVAGRELRDALIGQLRDGADIRIVCPILPTRAHLITSDIDSELAEARERLNQTLAWASEHGLRLSGRVSEETPLQAVADELAGYAADELIVSTHPQTRSKWLESGLVERLRAELEIPVHHVVVDLEAAARETADSVSESPGSR